MLRNTGYSQPSVTARLRLAVEISALRHVALRRSIGLVSQVYRALNAVGGVGEDARTGAVAASVWAIIDGVGAKSLPRPSEPPN